VWVNYASDFTRLRRVSLYLFQLYTSKIKHVQQVTTTNDYIIKALNIYYWLIASPKLLCQLAVSVLH